MQNVALLHLLTHLQNGYVTKMKKHQKKKLNSTNIFFHLIDTDRPSLITTSYLNTNDIINLSSICSSTSTSEHIKHQVDDRFKIEIIANLSHEAAQRVHRNISSFETEFSQIKNHLLPAKIFRFEEYPDEFQLGFPTNNHFEEEIGRSSELMFEAKCPLEGKRRTPYFSYLAKYFKTNGNVNILRTDHTLIPRHIISENQFPSEKYFLPPLHISAFFGDIESVKLILTQVQTKKDLLAPDGSSALTWAFKSQNFKTKLEMIELLIENNCYSLEDTNLILFATITLGDFNFGPKKDVDKKKEILSKLFSAGFSIYNKDRTSEDDDFTVLKYALTNFNIFLINNYLSNGGELYTKLTEYFTPISWILVDQYYNEHDTSSNFPAKKRLEDSKKIISMMLSAGAPVNYAEPYINTAFYGVFYSSKAGPLREQFCLEVLDMLIDSGLHVNNYSIYNNFENGNFTANKDTKFQRKLISASLEDSKYIEQRPLVLNLLSNNPEIAREVEELSLFKRAKAIDILKLQLEEHIEPLEENLRNLNNYKNPNWLFEVENSENYIESLKSFIFINGEIIINSEIQKINPLQISIERKCLKAYKILLNLYNISEIPMDENHPFAIAVNNDATEIIRYSMTEGSFIEALTTDKAEYLWELAIEKGNNVIIHLFETSGFLKYFNLDF